MKTQKISGGGRAKTTPEAASRVQRAVARRNQGNVPADSAAARMASAAAKNYGKSGGKTPGGSEK